MYNLEDYFGINSGQLSSLDRASPEAPPYNPHSAEEQPGGAPGNLVSSFTDWRGSPTFWLAVFAVLALGLIHAEGQVRLALR